MSGNARHESYASRPLSIRLKAIWVGCPVERYQKSVVIARILDD